MTQVRSDCPPQRLLEFLASEAGVAANEAAQSVASSKAEEEALLEEVHIPPCSILHDIQCGLFAGFLTPLCKVCLSLCL